MISIPWFRKKKGKEMILCENFYIIFYAHSRIDVLIYCLNYMHALVYKLLSMCTSYYFLFALLSIWKKKLPEIHLQFHILIYFGGCTFLSASILQFCGVKTWCGPLDKGLESASLGLSLMKGNMNRKSRLALNNNHD